MVVSFNPLVIPTIAVPIVSIPGWTSGLYYGTDTQDGYMTNYTNIAPGATLTAVPVKIPDAIQIDRIGGEITITSAAKSFRCGIYLPDGVRRRPGTLLLDSGNLSAGSAAFVEATVSQWLPAGLLWFVLHCEDATMNLRAMANTSRSASVGKSAGGSATAFGAIQVSKAFGALPATFTAGAVPVAGAPVINVRAV